MSETIEKPKVSMVCATCGSLNVTSDALVRWNGETQEWEISAVLDNSNCDDCLENGYGGAECNLDAVYIQDAGFICACGNCSWRGLSSKLNAIKHLDQRVAPGEPMPAGECPICGSLAHEEGTS